MSDPNLSAAERDRIVGQLMDARGAVGAAKRAGDPDAESKARDAVDRAKRALGERGPVWWDDGSPDLNRTMARNSPYADWFDGLGPA